MHELKYNSLPNQNVNPERLLAYVNFGNAYKSQIITKPSISRYVIWMIGQILNKTRREIDGGGSERMTDKDVK